MNQIQVLLNHLLEAKSYRDQVSNITAHTGWTKVTGLNDMIHLHQRMNQLIGITLNLHTQLTIENELDGVNHASQHEWIKEIFKGLSLEGNFSTNIDAIHKYTLDIIRSNVRNWNHGYTVHSSLDEEKILELIEKLQRERILILENKKLSHDLKRVLISEIDKLIYCLENYNSLGEEFTKEAITDFYSEAFFNKDIKEYYQKTPGFKEAIDQVSAAITIGTFSAPIFTNLIEMAQNTIQNLS